MIGWVAKLGPGRTPLVAFSQQRYGSQMKSDWRSLSDAGNGILMGSAQSVVDNDPNDANTPADSRFQQAWVQALVDKWGGAAAGGVRFYTLDNEPSLWHSTHRDVHPTGTSMEELLNKVLDYAGAIKEVDPAALIVGPEEWGWTGLFLSGLDQQHVSRNGFAKLLPDRSTHSDMDYIPWLLDQLRIDGRHLLDVVSVHYYPQGGEFGDDTSDAMQLRRNRSTRSLWDPEYIDESWIQDRVALIPKLRSWVDEHYVPGTPIALTEYNWGAEDHISGATAQADVLGIFGREGLDMATRWATPRSETPTYKAIKLYRNYDGAGSTFGNTSVFLSGATPDTLAAFAAIRSSDSALTIMIVSKYLSNRTPVTVHLTDCMASGRASVFQLTAENVIRQLPDATVVDKSLDLDVPSPSVTLLVIPVKSLRCDLSSDGLVNQLDLAVLLGAISGRAKYDLRLDLNRDGVLDGTDVRVLASVLQGTASCPF
jgi:hypothetical protein